MDLRVGGKFKLIKKCGSGAFGEIYQGKCVLEFLKLLRSIAGPCGFPLYSWTRIDFCFVILNRFECEDRGRRSNQTCK